jgi:hypothetical protein
MNIYQQQLENEAMMARMEELEATIDHLIKHVEALERVRDAERIDELEERLNRLFEYVGQQAKHLLKLQKVVFDQCDCPACTARREAEQQRDEKPMLH